MLACLCLSPCQQYYTNYMFLLVYLYPHSPYLVICYVFYHRSNLWAYINQTIPVMFHYFFIVRTYISDQKNSEKRVKTMSCKLRILAVTMLAMVVMPDLLDARYRYYQQRNAICFLPQKPGPNEMSCYAYYPRYYYNSRTGRCQFFVFGGCNGNANNFE